MESLGAARACPKPGGRPRKHTRREIVNGICYAIRSGGAWKLLPNDLPPDVPSIITFGPWRRQGIWAQIHDTVRQWVRQAAGREGQYSGPRAWPASQCGSVNKGVRVAMMGPRNCVGARVTYSWIAGVGAAGDGNGSRCAGP
jgi:transposase